MGNYYVGKLLILFVFSFNKKGAFLIWDLNLFILGKTIGSGTFGKVREGIHQLT